MLFVLGLQEHLQQFSIKKRIAISFNV